ncbi:acyl-CoA thioesterase [Paracoccus sediminicola]|uniref:acyl-CoA thioesterase n=1 Tax=Paracoccus sediminicola TaxID=3017783 RepID=UPI0022F144F7|nr:acyl-CoA thioesterase [Paracoccus sediminicola]WBU55693.1 acyl-CoA thioesterase [Paracoccus sediminicola]
MIYRREIQVEFNHCDPAGIVFYPRYFEMTNSVVENFFAEALNYPFRRMHMEEGTGVPTVRIEADFTAPSRLGDILIFSLEVERIGGASATLLLRASGRGEEGERLAARITLVWVTRGRGATAWPEEVRQRMETYLSSPMAG